MLTKSFHFFMFLTGVKSQSNYNSTVDYYVKVIEYGEAEALAYQLPENAYEYKPTNSKLTG